MLEGSKMLGQVRSICGLCRICTSSLPFRSMNETDQLPQLILQNYSMYWKYIDAKGDIASKAGVTRAVGNSAMGNVCSHLVNIDPLLKAWGQLLLDQAGLLRRSPNSFLWLLSPLWLSAAWDIQDLVCLSKGSAQNMLILSICETNRNVSQFGICMSATEIYFQMR